MRMEAKYVRRRRVLAAVVFIALVWWLNDITTPEACKTSVDNMSQFCKDLLYP